MGIIYLSPSPNSRGGSFLEFASFNGLIRDHPSPARPHAAQPYLQQTQRPHGPWQANRAPHGHDPGKVLKAILAMFPTNSYTTQFEVRGKNWVGNSLGANGEGLEAQIKWCGALTDWSF
jgi:hypothetical protein